ncbi:MAG TPA: hypothetical protein VG820_10425 [Fimbriimonadaceae bacterium]|nr:hypothetical protein [Fimbriimonadaceae bacterium]
MKTLEECCGPWLGAWIQFGVRGHMRLKLRFSDGCLSGGGADRIGSFSIVGSYDANDSVAFVKNYRTHRVSYRGKWDGAMIAGTWNIVGQIGTGPFEIWPESESMLVEEVFEQEASPSHLVNA